MMKNSLILQVFEIIRMFSKFYWMILETLEASKLLQHYPQK